MIIDATTLLPPAAGVGPRPDRTWLYDRPPLRVSPRR